MKETLSVFDSAHKMLKEEIPLDNAKWYKAIQHLRSTALFKRGVKRPSDDLSSIDSEEEKEKEEYWFSDDMETACKKEEKANPTNVDFYKIYKEYPGIGFPVITPGEYLLPFILLQVSIICVISFPVV